MSNGFSETFIAQKHGRKHHFRQAKMGRSRRKTNKIDIYILNLAQFDNEYEKKIHVVALSTLSFEDFAQDYFPFAAMLLLLLLCR